MKHIRWCANCIFFIFFISHTVQMKPRYSTTSL